MKKQILFLTFFVAAIFAGTNAFGQEPDYLTATAVADIDCATPTDLNCAVQDDALHPIPGKVYTYSVAVDPAFQATTSGYVHWFVTDQSTFVTGTATTAPVLQPDRDVPDGSGNYEYILTTEGHYNTQSTTIDIDISWQYFDPSNDVFLVAYVMGDDGCTDNIEAYKIEPSFGFKLDIEAMFDNGTLDGSGTANECVSPVESASWASDLLTVDYGQNYIFYSVNAANFTHSWQPSFTKAIANATSVLGDVEWAYPADAMTTGAWNSASTPVLAQSTDGAVGPDGECIVLRVLVDHGTANEIDTDDGAATVTVGVDGFMYDPSDAGYDTPALADLDNNTSGAATDPCLNNVTDEAEYTLDPRPEVTTNTEPGTADQPFEIKTGDN